MKIISKLIKKKLWLKNFEIVKLLSFNLLAWKSDDFDGTLKANLKCFIIRLSILGKYTYPNTKLGLIYTSWIRI